MTIYFVAVIQRAEQADSGLGLQSECPRAKMFGNFLIFDFSIKIVILHALLTVLMPNILLVNIQDYSY